MAAAFLLGASDRDDVDTLLQCLPGLYDQTRDRRDTVRRWIAHLYPGAVGDARPWAACNPTGSPNGSSADGG